jgi:long-chain acyl-CoA synthetase
MGERLGTAQMDVGSLRWPVSRAARTYHEKVAVVDEHEAVSYRSLEHRVRALTSGLDELNIAEGARVGFLGVNSLAHLECCMGVPSARRVLLDLNFRLSAPELEFIVQDSEPELLIVDAHQLAIGRRLRDVCSTVRELVFDGQGECPDDCVPYAELIRREVDESHPIAPDTLAAISYTGGTTGRPKGVMLSHGNLLANARHNLIATGHAPSDRWLHVCPMFHVAGTANIFACTWVGSLQFVLPRFDARAVIDTIRRERITHAVLVPTMLGMLLDELEREEAGEGLPTVKHIQYAASPITPTLQRRVLEAFDCDVVQFYGMTEAAPTVTQLSAAAHRAGFRGDEPWRERLRSIGVPVVGVEAEVRGHDGSELPVGEIGELWVRGPNVMLGYWAREEATHEALDDGWYRTGDAARADSDGFLYLVDRLKDMIITGGENVYSVEVEAALTEHSAVAEAAVFGIPDSRWGEAVHGVVSVADRSDVTAEALIAHCRTLLAGYKVPRTIAITDEPLPKSGAGKVLKKDLREPYWVGHERRVS